MVYFSNIIVVYFSITIYRIRIHGNMELRTYGEFCKPEVMKTCLFPSEMQILHFFMKKVVKNFGCFEKTTYLCTVNPCGWLSR